jgi:hypothetical protein
MRLRALAICGCLAAASAHGATFTVTNLNDSGAGSLRQAIADANTALGADTIVFQAGLTGTITLTSGLMLVTEALTIQGPGPAALTIDGNALNRIFAITENNVVPACPSLTGPSDYPVSISGLTIRNGQRNVANSSSGAILSLKSLALSNMVFENNRARGGGAVGFFLQYPNQSLTVANSRFTGNEAREILAPTSSTHAGGAILVAENCTGTRTMPVTVTIEDSVFSGNLAQAGTVNARGGAIQFSGDADVTINRVTIDGNRALPNPANANVNAQGGGISGGSQTLTIRDSTISGNEAQRSAALQLFNDGLVRQTFQERMRVELINSTISGNRAYETSGLFVFANIQFVARNSSIVGNRSDQNRTSGFNLVTGPTVPASASNAVAPTLELESTVVWNPLGVRDIGKDVSTMPGALAIPSNNSIIGRLCDESCGAGPMTLVGAGNQVGVDPLLGPLAANGGPTQTRLPQLGSPAIGAGSNQLALTEDQRGTGFPRTIGATTDVGAIEYTYGVQCDGFADVAGNSPFCASVSWMKNRAVTLGCGGANYCPDNNVSRLSMAAFMKRLGDALSGIAILRVQTSGLLDFATAPVVCQTDPIAAATAPRRAVLDAIFAGFAGADSLARAQLVVSEDGGTTWTDTQLYTSRATFRAGQWRNVRVAGHRDVEAGKAVRFGLQMSLPGGPGGVTDSTCRLRVRLENSAGFTPL